MRKTLVRTLKITLATALLLLLAATVTIRVQEYLLYHRAERLLSDIRSIETGKSSFSDAQAFVARWKNWGEVSSSCTEKKCDFMVTLGHILPAPETRAQLGLELLNALGSHFLGGDYPTMVRGEIGVFDGHIWSRGYGLTIFQKSQGPHSALAIEARTADMPFTGFPHMADHPEFVFLRPDENEDYGYFVRSWLHYTPFADSATISRLLDFRLECMHKSSQCSEAKDVMPTAAAYDQDRPAISGDLLDCVVPLNTRTRGYDGYLAGTVTAVNQQSQPGAAPKLTITITPDPIQPVGALTTQPSIRFSAAGTNDRSLQHLGITPKTGTGVYVLADSSDKTIDEPTWSCRLAPRNEESRRLIELGRQQHALMDRLIAYRDTLVFVPDI